MLQNRKRESQSSPWSIANERNEPQVESGSSPRQLSSQHFSTYFSLTFHSRYNEPHPKERGCEHAFPSDWSLERETRRVRTNYCPAGFSERYFIFSSCSDRLVSYPFPRISSTSSVVWPSSVRSLKRRTWKAVFLVGLRGSEEREREGK